VAALPKTALGKVQRSELAKLLAGHPSHVLR
jgi:acyl-coenzyme A synthetase/AMP-(fatty) acid ligase